MWHLRFRHPLKHSGVCEPNALGKDISPAMLLRKVNCASVLPNDCYQDHLKKRMFKKKCIKLMRYLHFGPCRIQKKTKRLPTTASHNIRLIRSLSVPSKFARLCGKTHAWHWFHQLQLPNLFRNFCISAHSHDKYWLVQSVSTSQSHIIVTLNQNAWKSSEECRKSM